MKSLLIAIVCMCLLIFPEEAQANADWIELHGPEKPPPDDGYTFKTANGGNALGKIGLVAMGAGIITSVLFISAEEDTEKKSKLGISSASLLGGGFVLLLIERAT